MNKVLRKRLCWNCESQVSLDVETCPVCGVSVVPAFLEGAGADFAPPYSTSQETDFGIPKSPYETEDSRIPFENHENEKKSVEEQYELDGFKRAMISMVLLLSGSVFFLFSMALGLFSHNGIFTLQWDGSYWFAYTLVAVMMFFFGWRSLKKLD